MEVCTSNSDSGSNTESHSTEEIYPDWIELPTDVLLTIFSKFEVKDILKTLQLVCKLWCDASNEPLLWRSIDIQSYGEPENFQMCERITKIAVNRSCGGLNDICIESFGNDDILFYIADRSPQLKCLRLQCGYDISGAALVDAVRKLPLLEEVELTICRFAHYHIKEVGRSCPNLKTFKLNNQGSKDLDSAYDDEAMAIAETMPGLRHIELIGNCMTNEGLKAILDSCDHLEHLDLRACFCIDISGDFGKRIMKQIKKVRHPNDRDTSDYRFHLSYDSDYDDYAFGDFYDEFDGMDYISDDEGYEFSDSSEFVGDDDGDFDDDIDLYDYI